ncbi:MAG TPA: signal peptidase II [Bryobacteraceae bacterium]|nr:signal peptidase II [Bryobacteraceae bacterium]
MDKVRAKAFVIAAVVFALDRWTKWLIERRVSFADDIRIIPGFFSIVHSENRGVAFGVFNDSESQWRTIMLIALSLIAVVWVAVVVMRSRHLEALLCWAFGLVLGGAAGNLFDRAISGKVTDFLLFYVGSYQWPSFNIADSAIVIGCGLLLLDQLWPKRRTAHVS